MLRMQCFNCSADVYGMTVVVLTWVKETFQRLRWLTMLGVPQAKDAVSDVHPPSIKHCSACLRLLQAQQRHTGRHNCSVMA